MKKSDKSADRSGEPSPRSLISSILYVTISFSTMILSQRFYNLLDMIEFVPDPNRGHHSRLETCVILTPISI